MPIKAVLRLLFRFLIVICTFVVRIKLELMKICHVHPLISYFRTIVNEYRIHFRICLSGVSRVQTQKPPSSTHRDEKNISSSDCWHSHFFFQGGLLFLLVYACTPSTALVLKPVHPEWEVYIPAYPVTKRTFEAVQPRQEAHILTYLNDKLVFF